MASKISTTDRDFIGELATKTGRTREEVTRALDSLLYGDGAVYRQMLEPSSPGKVA